MKEKLWIFDTTLRDGNQAPGCGLFINEKLEIAEALADLGVDIIEAGFPISSNDEFEAVKRIAKKFSAGGPIICGFARTTVKDINQTWKAVKYAKKRRIHLGIGTSDIHLKYKLQKSRQEILDIAVNSVVYAKKFDWEVQFFAEDATRSDEFYLRQVLTAVIDHGATIINIPDTTGIAYPQDYFQLIQGIKKCVPNVNQAIISVHCHNDLGLGTADSLEGIRAGARQAECTILGIGERTGNAALEEIVANIEERQKIFKGIYTNINLNLLNKVAKLITRRMNLNLIPNKSIVGLNSFATEAGIHADGTIKEKSVYLCLDPQKYGQNLEIVFGSRSGRGALKWKLEILGFGEISRGDLENFYNFFKKEADKNVKRRTLTDDGLIKLAKKFGLSKK